MARIVLNTFGSLGDLHPYLAIAIGLKNRGHQPVVATSEVYREKVQGEGVEFAPVRPNVGELLSDGDFLEKLWHPRLGSEHLLRKYIIPSVEQSYEDLLLACRGADLILTHAAGPAGPIAAQVLKIAWLSVALQPLIFFSSYDPPVLAPAAWVRHLYPLGQFPFRVLMALGEVAVNSWAKPILRLRERVGLPRPEANPLLRGQFSPWGTLGLFSPYFAAPQPDWPPNVWLTGFVFHDEGAAQEKAHHGLARFLADGPPPVLFTLGSSAVMRPGVFYRESIAAIHELGIRAVLLTGTVDQEQFPPLADSIFLADYLPYSQIMPRAAAIVHQGGIGTTAQALRSGRPMLVVPWAHDQPDNAERISRLGAGRTIARSRYYAPRVAKELLLLLKETEYESRARDLGETIANEDGMNAACDAIEEVLHQRA